jgi:hypothetical protein
VGEVTGFDSFDLSPEGGTGKPAAALNFSSQGADSSNAGAFSLLLRTSWTSVSAIFLGKKWR